mmetsp:Transcript_56021/g.137390  ORF Transcript_56021/g.137390 Transcript_56021/m.137390 type:complete len:119 (-) Transcript_56021:322-678(-)
MGNQMKCMKGPKLAEGEYLGSAANRRALEELCEDCEDDWEEGNFRYLSLMNSIENGSTNVSRANTGMTANPDAASEDLDPFEAAAESEGRCSSDSSRGESEGADGSRKGKRVEFDVRV